MASKKITEMVEVLSLEDTDLITGIDLSAPDSDKNVKIAKSALGFVADADPRLSDARLPTTHGGTHEDGGSDELALIAAQITDFQTAVNAIISGGCVGAVPPCVYEQEAAPATPKVGDIWIDTSFEFMGSIRVRVNIVYQPLVSVTSFSSLRLVFVACVNMVGTSGIQYRVNTNSPDWTDVTSVTKLSDTEWDLDIAPTLLSGTDDVEWRYISGSNTLVYCIGADDVGNLGTVSAVNLLGKSGPLLDFFPDTSTILLLTQVDVNTSLTDQNSHTASSVSGWSYAASGGPRGWGPRLVGTSGRANWGSLFPQGSYTFGAWVLRASERANIWSGDSSSAFWVSDLNASYGFNLSASNTNAGGSFHDVYEPRATPVDHFYHFAVTYDADAHVMTLYRNGVQVGQGNGILPSTDNALWLGAWNNSILLNGSLCDPFTYDRVLSLPELHLCMVSRNIMLLGNSITDGVGSSDGFGYRRNLQLDLQSTGHAYNLVGSQSDGTGADLCTFHEGIPGETVEDLATLVTGYLNDNPANIVVLHAGTNDLSGQSPAAVVSEIEDVLNAIFAWSAETHVFLCQIIETRDGTLSISTYKSLLATMVSGRSSDPITLIDLETVLDSPGDYSDNLHPNDTGYDKMGTAIAAGLRVLLNQVTS